MRPRRGPGLLLVLPAALTALTALVTLVVPTRQTILRSVEAGGGVLGRPTRVVGLDNYTHLLGSAPSGRPCPSPSRSPSCRCW